MNITALPYGFRQHFLNGAPQSGVVVTDDELYSLQGALPQAHQQLAPTRKAFPICQFHRQHVAPTFPVHSNPPDMLPGDWSVAQPTVLGSITAAEYDLRTAPVTALFLRLGDYQEQCLWEQTNGCSTRNPNPPAPPYVAVTIACPGDATSVRLACATPAPSQQVDDPALAGALEAAIERFRPTTVGMLDASGVFFDALGRAGDSAGYTEYPDHYYSALYALSATLRATAVTGELPAIASYRGYTIAREAPNLTDSVACTKDLAFDAYAPFDPDVGAEHELYAIDNPASYQRRSYPLRTVPPRSGVLRNQNGCLGVVAERGRQWRARVRGLGGHADSAIEPNRTVPLGSSASIDPSA